MRLFKRLAAVAVNTVLLPVEVVKDVADAINPYREVGSNTSDRVKRIGQNVEDIVDELENGD